MTKHWRKHFTYLGRKVSNNGDTMKEINSHIAIAASAFTKLTNIWQSQDLSICTKVKLFRSCVIPVLTYGCESWKSTKKIDKKLDSFENKCLRKLLKVKWSDFVSNNTVRDRTHQQPVSNIIRKRRWKYLGHVLIGYWLLNWRHCTPGRPIGAQSPPTDIEEYAYWWFLWLAD